MNRKFTIPVLSSLVFTSAVYAALTTGCTITTKNNDSDGGLNSTNTTSDGGKDSSTTTTSDAGSVSDSGTVVVNDACSFGEPNEDRDHATAIALGTTYVGACLAAGGDKDFYEFTAPNDPAGGYVTFSASNVGQGMLEYHVYTVSDNGEIFSAYVTDKGKSAGGYFAVAPGQKYRIQWVNFAGDATEKYTYDFKTTYTPFADSFEPNNERSAAKAITVGTSVSAQIGGGYRKKEIEDADIDDWYSVDLDLKTKSYKITLSQASDFMGDVEVYGPDGAKISEEYTTTPGADVTSKPAAADLIGKFTIRVHTFAGFPKCSGDGDTLPKHFTTPYKLVVTQL